MNRRLSSQPPQQSLPSSSRPLSTSSLSSLNSSSSSVEFRNLPSTAHTNPIKLKAGGALNALSASPDKDQVVVAGREVLKILSVTDTEVKEVLNLRIGSRLNLNFSSNDVKWCNHYAKFTIATAATNGAIVIWDLQKPGQKLERVINEHTRAVNRVTFHPTEPILLLSASQDGTLKLWDLRAKNFARHTFEGKAESVRDVQFSPTFAYEFAAAFENGTIQRWDIRNPSLYERKLNAHNGLALTVDYHPDGRLVASGGRDKMIKIWDMKSDTRKPIYYIQTIASVARISWRPSFSNSASTFPSATSPPYSHLHSSPSATSTSVSPSELAQSFNSYQIASCSLLTDHRIHVYDLSRPCIPQYSLDVHDNVTTGFLWDDSETLWSVGKDKYFVKSYIRAATKPVSEVSKSAVGWNGYGDLTIAVDEGGSVGEGMEGSRPNIMSPSLFARRLQKNKPQERIVPETLPQLYKPKQKTITLSTGVFDSQSFILMALGYRFGSDDEDLTSDASADKGDSENETYYRTQHELSSASKTKGSGATTLRLIKICESNSQVAWNCGHYRTAESWKLLAMFYSSAPSAANPPHDPSLNSSNRKSLQRPEQNNSYIYGGESGIARPTRQEGQRRISGFEGKAMRSQSAHTPSNDSDSFYQDSDFPPSINVNSPSSTSTSFLSNSLSSRQPQLSSQSGVVADPGVETPLVLRGGVDRITTLNNDVITLGLVPELDDGFGVDVGLGLDLGGRTRYGSVDNRLEVRQEFQGIGGMVGEDWDPKEMVEEMLMHYANQGDVQMCVTVLLVLRNNLKSFKLSASLEKLEEQWFFSYIDLLHRFKLWSTAAAVMSSCTIASVRAYNQESTTIYTTCNNCFKPLMNSKGSYWYCEKCTKLLNTCSLCHRPVKGLYVWCQSCSHGGHLSCLQTWFQGCSSCPTGCGHHCVGELTEGNPKR